MNNGIARTVAIVFLSAVLTAGCAGYGKLGPAVPPDTGPEVDELLDRWNDVEVSSVYSPGGRPVALLFDPKGDDRLLTDHQGDRIATPAEALEVKRSIEIEAGRPTRLVSVLGPDGASFGYAYTSLRHLVLKAVDGKTLKAYAPSVSDRQSGP